MQNHGKQMFELADVKSLDRFSDRLQNQAYWDDVPQLNLCLLVQPSGELQHVFLNSTKVVSLEHHHLSFLVNSHFLLSNHHFCGLSHHFLLVNSLFSLEHHYFQRSLTARAWPGSNLQIAWPWPLESRGTRPLALKRITKTHSNQSYGLHIELCWYLNHLMLFPVNAPFLLVQRAQHPPWSPSKAKHRRSRPRPRAAGIARRLGPRRCGRPRLGRSKHGEDEIDISNI